VSGATVTGTNAQFTNITGENIIGGYLSISGDVVHQSGTFTDLRGYESRGSYETRSLKFYQGDNTQYVAFRAPVTLDGTSTTFRLPSGDSTSGDVLTTDGAGRLSWSAGGGGGGGSSLSGATLTGTTALGIDTAVITGTFGASGSTFIGYQAGAGWTSPSAPQALRSGVAVGSYALSGCGPGIGNQDTSNIAIGFAAGADTTPSGVIFIGRNAGRSYNASVKMPHINSIHIGDNTSIGTGAVGATNNESNIVIGHEALRDISDGNRSIIVGHKTALNGAGGQLYDSIAIGHSAISGSQPVQSGIYIGNNAGSTQTTSYLNLVIGHDAFSSGAGVSTDNCIIGNRTANLTNGQLQHNTIVGGSNCATYLYSGSYNTVVGSFIADNYNFFDPNGYWTNGWSEVTAIGQFVARQNEYRSECVYIGSNVGHPMNGQNNVLIGSDIASPTGVTHSGSHNVCIGNDILNYFGSASINHNTLIGGNNFAGGNPNGCVAIGHSAGREIYGGGGYSVFVGYNATARSLNYSTNGTAVGAYSFMDLQTGSNNTALGYFAGGTLASGNNNTLIGYSATSSASSVDNEFTLGNSSVATLRCNQTSITSLSDERDKTNITDLDHGVNFIRRLRPVKFDWARRDGSLEGKKDYGFIAQELQAVENELNTAEYTNLVLDKNPDKLEAAPLKTYPILVQAVKELINRLEAAEQAIAELQST